MLDAAAAGGTIRRMEDGRSGGMSELARRLGDEGVLRDGVTPEEAAHVLVLLTSFESFDRLSTGEGLSVEKVAELLVAMAERTLLR